MNRAWSHVLHWLLAFGTAMGLVVVSKLAFMAWNVYPPLLNFTGMSGHTASSSMLYLALALLLSQGRSQRTRLLWLATAGVLIVAVALSRFVVKAHSGSEIACGLAVGLLFSWWFASRTAAMTQPLRGRIALLLLALLLYSGAGQRPAPTQGMLEVIAMKLSGHPFVYRRTRSL